MLWQIEGSNTYVLGSVHVTNMARLTLSDIAGRIFEQADRVIFEADQKVAPDASLFMLPPDTRLDRLMEPPVFRRVHAHWARLGLPDANLLVLRPVMVAMTLQISEASRNGYLTQFGVDHLLRERSELARKKIDYLEDLNDQLRLLMSTPLSEQVSLLDHIATPTDAGFSEIEAMVSAWQNHDLGHFENLLEDRRKLWPQSVDAVLTRRNEDWAPLIAEMVRAGTHNLIVVGALHLVGPTGLPVLLRQQGLHLAPRQDV
ncbi:TraB/GumN family protein [Paraburkholderia sp. B3]|uniref:TraB/GumN family protein n=1 Tax=Paraburkholderia sp. B3 TaxID=3134791 RepID=UPI0039820DC1